MISVVFSVILIGALGLIIGILLSIASKKLYVEVDKRELEILDVLPGNNCGGCGYAGCQALASAITKNEADTNACIVGGNKVSELVAKIMGSEAKKSTRKTAFVACSGDNIKCKKAFNYEGFESCKAANSMFSGDKACKYGCLGLGDCVKICQFDAISIINGIAKVDKNKCKSCSKCVEVCPKGLISLIPETISNPVKCSSRDIGKDVIKKCDAGCIACGICVKTCEYDAIHIVDNRAVKDVNKCISCGKCDEKCPRHCMV